MTRLPNGTRVHLPDGSEALAYYDGNSRYRTAQPSGYGGVRVDHGWVREFLAPIEEEVRS